MIKPEALTYMELVTEIGRAAVKLVAARTAKRRARIQARLSSLEAEAKRRDGVAV